VLGGGEDRVGFGPANKRWCEMANFLRRFPKGANIDNWVGWVVIDIHHWSQHPVNADSEGFSRGYRSHLRGIVGCAIARLNCA